MEDLYWFRMVSSALRLIPVSLAAHKEQAATAVATMAGYFLSSSVKIATPRFRRVVHAPQHLRALVRADEIWLTVLASFIGSLAGFCVWVMTCGTLWLHRLLFAPGNNGRLSGLLHISPWRALLVPTLGGLAMGLFGLLVARWIGRQPIDPIEANALYGGRMSVRDSLVVAAQTFISNGAGASIGLEAGFTQIAAALGSWLGQAFRVRREDLRVLVGCGAGGAIGAAFNAPVAGAFYAFELVIGAYSLVNLPPVAFATISAIGMTYLLGGVAPVVSIFSHDALSFPSGIAAAILGVVCALVGIAIMKGVTLTERLFRRLPGPAWLHTSFGGLIVGGMAIDTPSVLSAGHAAMHLVLDGDLTLSRGVVLLLLKAVAVSVSIGSGFRGGLFFASLYIGVLTGDIFGGVLVWGGYGGLSLAACAVLGMSAMAGAIVGSPMTMICLTLEMTGNFTLSGAVLLASVASLLTVRRLFGYSFATWRFHLRGESIRSAVDIGWLRTLNVRRMMREQVRMLPPDMSLACARALFPPGSAQRLVLAGEDGRYRGMVPVVELYNPVHPDEAKLDEIAILMRHMLTPQMNVREAVAAFEKAEADELVVVDHPDTRRVLGILTEKHALRRYAEELDRTRRELAGEARQRTYG